MLRHDRSLSTCEEIQHQLIESVGMFPLRPMPTVAEDMQFRTGNAGQQTQTRIHRHKAVVTPPDNQGLRFDFRQTWAKIRELFRISFRALNEVFQ